MNDENTKVTNGGKRKNKKRPPIFVSILCGVLAAMLTIGVFNPFGFFNYNDFFRFSTITKTINKLYYKEVPAEDYLNSAIEGYAQGTGDAYTNYIYGDAAKEYMEDISGSFEGIGVYIENHTEDNTITVVSAISGSPAEEAGIVSGDKILTVSGVNYTGEQMEEAVKNMKGQEGTTVDISVLKADSGQIVSLTVERRKIDVKTVESKKIDNTNIGYVSISQFTETTSSDFRESFEKLLKGGISSLVIDLRNNPGGIMDVAVEVASNFVKSGDTVVYTLDRSGNREDYNSKGKQWNIPIVVLINQGSASASEILTGALKDYGLAHVIGEKSYGKGIVQTVFGVGDNLLSITIASYYTPSGVCIHGLGIEPDENIPMELEKYSRLSRLDMSEDIQLSAAVEYLMNNK